MFSLSLALCVLASLNTCASRTPYSPAGTGGFYANHPFLSNASSYVPIVIPSRTFDEQPAGSRLASYTPTSPHTKAFSQQPQAYTGVQNPQPFATPLYSLQHPLSLHLTPAPSTLAQISIRPSSGAWNPQDDSTLMAARVQGMNWAPIQQAYFPNKTPNACRKRHERLMERRSADSWDGRKIENLAKHYMSLRREIWAPLAAQIGEKWNVVEQMCMSQGLKNLQVSARSCARRERTLDSTSLNRTSKRYDDDSGYADNVETQFGDDIDSESTRGHEYAQVFSNGYHQQQQAMSSVPTATIASSSTRTNHFSAAATSWSSRADTKSSGPQKAESVHQNLLTNISNNSHPSPATTADSYLKEMPEDHSRLQRKVDKPIDPYLPPRTRAALVKYVLGNDSGIHVNESHNVQLQLRTSSPPENIRSVIQLAARDEDPGGTANEAGVSLIKQSNTQAISSPLSSN
ncbi:hypothetical protein BDZ45DRAFT_144106 [Acephala macrosclerotiorum]|nr:hypothetical protein BDZ45DRAFT_144106 [Acephala macrosclerotiorum]